jgi:hypothetical protein
MWGRSDETRIAGPWIIPIDYLHRKITSSDGAVLVKWVMGHSRAYQVLLEYFRVPRSSSLERLQEVVDLFVVLIRKLDIGSLDIRQNPLGISGSRDG